MPLNQNSWTSMLHLLLHFSTSNSDAFVLHSDDTFLAMALSGKQQMLSFPGVQPERSI